MLGEAGNCTYPSPWIPNCPPRQSRCLAVVAAEQGASAARGALPAKVSHLRNWILSTSRSARLSTHTSFRSFTVFRLWELLFVCVARLNTSPATCAPVSGALRTYPEFSNQPSGSTQASVRQAMVLTKSHQRRRPPRVQPLAHGRHRSGCAQRIP